MVCAVWGVGVLQGWCLRCHQQRSHFQGNSHWYWWVAVTEEESYQVGESGWGLAHGCYFQLQGTGAELTAKAFVHPARGRRLCLVVYVCWEMRGGRGAWERAGGREKGVGGWVETLAPAPGFDVETEHWPLWLYPRVAERPILPLTVLQW